MTFAGKLTRVYFDVVYNRVYDFTTGRLNRYRRLQRTCVGKLGLKNHDKVLCVGLGTGNEVLHILRANRNVKIVGVDYSKTALQKAYRKALIRGKEIEALIMDAQRLQFAAGSFDKVLCLHVMDFIEDDREATKEIIRVLKDGGKFVITYPSGKEGPRLGVNLLSDSVRQGIDSGKPRIRALSESLAQILVGIVYLPLLFRPKRRSYSRGNLEAMLSQLAAGDFQIEEDPIYQDFIVYGTK